MGRAFAGDGFFIDLFCALAVVATGTFVAAAVVWSPAFRRPEPRKRGTPSSLDYILAGFANWFVFAQASFVQTDAHVGRGEVNQLPTVFGWWADKSPEWFKHFSVGFCLVVEIIVPFFIWAPRHLRLIAAGLLIFLQLAIAITGNYCFFNLLTIALCLLLIDDSVAASLRRGPMRHRVAGSATQCRDHKRRAVTERLSTYGAIGMIIVTLPINAWLIFSAFKPLSRPPRVLANLYEKLEPFRIVNGYGLFRVMTKDRGEIVLEGSADGIDWLPYEFKWKPGDVKRAPRWCAPHQPRLDWQMWFAALGTPRENPWFVTLIYRLLQGSHEVDGLLANNPFPHNPPRYIRAMFYRYRFTTVNELRKTGARWKREELREYLPTLSLEQFR
jgi:hypothetical protein